MTDTEKEVIALARKLVEVIQETRTFMVRTDETCCMKCPEYEDCDEYERDSAADYVDEEDFGKIQDASDILDDRLEYLKYHN